MDTYRLIEQVFLHTPHRLVSTFSVLKVESKGPGSPAKSQTTQHAKSKTKPRTVCVTVARRIGSPGFKATLHVLKRVSGEFQIRKSYRLKYVLSLEGAHSVDDHPVCRLTFRVPGAARLGAKKDVLAYECATEEVQSELLGVVYSFCRDHEAVVPKLIGVARSDLGVYGEGEDDDRSDSDWEEDAALAVSRDDRRVSTSQMVKTTLSSKTVIAKQTDATEALSVATQATAEAAAAAAAEAATSKEAATKSRRRQTNYNIDAIRADILLDAVSDGASSLEDACKKITLERQALDEANMHELLELSGVSKRIHNDVLEAVSHLDDLEDAFLGFDAQLRHVSKSISVIDESSSYLKQHHTKNAHDSRLDALIKLTKVDPSIEHVLLETPISVRHIGRIREAFLKLQESIEALESENRDANVEIAGVGNLDDVRAVRETKQKMKNVRSQFVVKAVEYFDGEMDKAVSGGGQHVYVKLHEKLAMLAPLLELLCSADPCVAKERFVGYVRMTEGLLIREAKDCLENIVRVQRAGAKVAGIGKEVLKAETALLENVKSGDAAARRDVLSHIKGSDVSAPFANMVSTLIPRIANETSVLADLLEKANLTEHVGSEYAAGVFVESIEPIFNDCVAAVKSSRGLALLDMTGATSALVVKLSTVGGMGGRSSERLSTMLQRVLDLIKAHWDAFVGEIHLAIRERWKEIRSRAASAEIHVLPFVANFEYIAGRIEAIVAEWIAKEGVMTAPSLSSTLPSSAATSQMVRRMADNMYSLVLPEIVKTVEIFSGDHEKHKDRIKMENYAFLRTSMQSLGASKSSEVLKRHSDEAARLRDSAVKSYVSNLMIQSLLFKPLAGTEPLVRGDELDTVFDDLSAIETALRYVSKAVQRDFGASSYLVRVVWDRVEARVLQALDLLDDDVGQAAIRRMLLKSKN